MTTGAAAYRNTASREEIVERYGYLVKRIAHHLIARLPDTVQFDDLLQAGMLGLIESQSKYDASKGASFATYAGIRIRGAMLDEMRRGDWAPRSVHRNSRRVTDAMKAVEKRTGRQATVRDIADEMGVSLEDYYDILHDAASCKLVSYEEVNDGEDPSILPQVASGDQAVERDAMLEYLAQAIGALPERERLVMALYYDEELNLKEIGSILEVSESRVSQILSQATLRVRGKIGDWVDT
jgi:RNA polymerase sigma factor for flagellar operon FliA